ncbi:MAG: AAA family ATPase [Prevotellaceae bacterium]|jgi:exodeoxyribonuclease-5|nr:AAA family ATPase [Prevotellaceae bacterium]
MLKNHVLNKLHANLKYKPTLSQTELLDKLAEFVIDINNQSIFVVSGFAGTGKTSAISALVATLKELQIKYVLLAPTGRAAKVLTNYSGEKAFTVHKKIYRQKSSADAFGKFVLDRNAFSNTVFIVDEASMISNSSVDQSVFGSGRLLDDLVEFVRSGKSCRLILVGDRAQLPPVGLDESPALNCNELRHFGDVEKINLNDVVRQAADSEILSNANRLRRNIDGNIIEMPKFHFTDIADVELINSADVVAKIDDAYTKYGFENTSIISYSNRRANRYNQGIRTRIFGREEELVTGDLLMVVKNCYQFIDNSAEIDFIANGDIAEVMRIGKYEQRYGFRFANVTLCFHDYNDAEIDCKIMLDTLTIESASLSYDDSRKFYAQIAEDYMHIANKRKRYCAIREDLYFNALQVKYAYAITCHKAQGGQWAAVFLDKLFFKEQLTISDLRWLYTAFTRATEKLFLIDFDKKYYSIDNINRF